ncbi:MAG: FAD-dependent oxidoreductase, partial [Alkalispirochaeta sp.]
MEHSYDVTIVGAGIAGLAAARELASAGLRTLVLDKGRQVGGRMATRRVRPGAFYTGAEEGAFDTGARGGAFDTGAQFFTAVAPEFRALVADAANAGVVTQWYQRAPRTPDHEPLPVWRGRTGMTDLPKWIAAGLQEAGTVDIRTSTRVTEVLPTQNGVRVLSESTLANGAHSVGSEHGAHYQSGKQYAHPEPTGGDSISTGTVILTPPLPQALMLIPTALRNELDPGLVGLSYDPCLALLITIEAPLVALLNDAGYVRPAAGDSMIAWVADNTRKGLPDEAAEQPSRLTVHSTGEAARELYDAEESHATAELAAALKALLPSHEREAVSRAHAQGATQ